MKHHSLSKVLKRLACVLAALVIALAVAVFALWHNELATLSSLKKLRPRRSPPRRCCLPAQRLGRLLLRRFPGPGRRIH